MNKIASAEQDEFPIAFSIRDFKPGYAWRRPTVWPGDAAGIEKQNIPASFIARHVRVTVQQNIDIIRWLLGRNVLQAKFQSASHKVDNQWPFKITVAISAHHSESGSDPTKLVEDAFRAKISKMPDFISLFCHLGYIFRQTVVRVRQHKNAQRFFRLLFLCH